MCYNRFASLFQRGKKMNFKIDTIYHGFRLIEESEIKELQGTARIFKHEKSGAVLIYISNTETNKVFTVTFKTPPEDDKGTAHIIEHAVCCSSEKYPFKDTFIELEKGSLCTALNACTYQDMTMYYCASQNDKDFKHLLEVYLDLIFHPLAVKAPHFFMQEGWHYELENEKSDITYNGVVYNEMQGEYDDAATVLEHTVNQILLCETPYRFDSGGVPEAIPTLSYEEFLTFYKRYYEPANASFFLYGDGDVLEHLAFIDRECLSHFSKNEVKAEIPMQRAFERPKYIHQAYPVSSDTNTKDKTLFALNFVVGTAEDAKLRLSFEILEQLLLISSSSPLVEELIVNKQLGKCLGEAGYNACKRQPVFSIVLRETQKNKKDDFEQTVFAILSRLSEKGIDKKLLKAALNTVAFRLKEAEYDGEPRGLIYSELIQNSLLYGGAPYNHLCHEEILRQIKQEADKGYFEALIKEYLLENKHRALVILEPSKALKKQKETMLRQSLKAFKKSLNKQQIKQLIESSQKLDAVQNTSLSQNVLQKLPQLKLEDLNKKAETILLTQSVYDGVKILFNEDNAGDIAYVHLLFDTTGVAEADIPYIGLLASLVTYLDTAHYNHLEIDCEINRHLGGLNCAVNAYPNHQKSTDYKPLFKISAKLFAKKIPAFTALLTEIINSTQFTNVLKMKEIIGQIKYEIEQSFENSSEYIAVQRMYTSISYAGAYEDYVSGISYYLFIKNLYRRFDEDFENISSKLNEVFASIMMKPQLTVFITAAKEQKDWIEAHVKELISGLKEKKIVEHAYIIKPETKNEAFITSGSLYSIALGLKYQDLGWHYHGIIQVISHLLERTYLWERIRLQGGAYGCQLAVSSDGNLVVYSYLDPELLETIDCFETMGTFLENLQMSQQELERCIIGTIGLLDMPLGFEQRSERALTAYLCGITNSDLQKTRDEILAVTLEEIHRFAALFKTINRQNNLCVVGAAASIISNQKLFKTIWRMNQ